MGQPCPEDDLAEELSSLGCGAAILFAVSARHWQQIEAGRPITLTTLLRICEALDVRLTAMVAGLDRKSKN